MAAAAEYYREMRAALDETDFRWLQLGETPSAATKLRRERMAVYGRYRKLFELEIARPEAGLWEKVALLRYRAMLAFASLLFRFAIPGRWICAMPRFSEWSGSPICRPCASGGGGSEGHGRPGRSGTRNPLIVIERKSALKIRLKLGSAGFARTRSHPGTVCAAGIECLSDRQAHRASSGLTHIACATPDPWHTHRNRDSEFAPILHRRAVCPIAHRHRCANFAPRLQPRAAPSSGPPLHRL